MRSKMPGDGDMPGRGAVDGVVDGGRGVWLESHEMRWLTVILGVGMKIMEVDAHVGRKGW